MAANYFKIISNLIQWNDRLSTIKEYKLQPLIQLLQDYNYEDKEDWECPSNKELAAKLNIPDQKLNILLRKLYPLVLESFYDFPLKPKICVQTIYIHIPYDEYITKDKEYQKRLINYSTWINVDLAKIPRIGEEIRLDIFELDDKFTRGIVSNISHCIKGCKHDILIEVHPFDNEYARWLKLEQEYNWNKARERRIKEASSK